MEIGVWKEYADETKRKTMRLFDFSQSGILPIRLFDVSSG